MSRLEVRRLCLALGGKEILHDVDLLVEEGELLVLLGPSGCGKTTLLRCIAGLQAADSGDIRLEGEQVNDRRAEQRGVGMVFQSPTLFPHLDVGGNVAFALEPVRLGRRLGCWLKRRQLGIHDQQARIEEALHDVGLAGFSGRQVANLSGGEAQRVALARALIAEPRVLLLDEPLSALDMKMRESMRKELVAVLRKLSITALFVTHDQSEAFAIADKVALMHDGSILQVATPEHLFRTPVNGWAARFLGHTNLLPPGVLAPSETLLPEWGLSLEPREHWKKTAASLVEQRFERGRYRLELQAFGHRLSLLSNEQPGEVTAIWYESSSVVELE